MQMRRRSWFLTLAAAVVLSSSLGCVERTAKIQTQPPGALVIVNDEEVGVSPVKFSFLWYGDYDIILRKPGYTTLKTHYQLNAPWYQYPPIDLVAETMVPLMIHDDQVVPAFTLEPEVAPSADEVVGRAVELRDRALFEGE
jgi:hypothetical protein